MHRWKRPPISSPSKRVLDIRTSVPLRPKTTMRIGGSALYFAELTTRADVEEAYAFAKEKNVPLLPLGGGSNTIFADQEIRALVVQVRHADIVQAADGTICVGAGATLATLIQTLAKDGRDLSALTGIPGTVGGAIVGNAGQGPTGVWLDSFIQTVTMFDGTWRTLPREACHFGYRTSAFLHPAIPGRPPLVWEAACSVPHRPAADIHAHIEELIKRRIATQPHARTAGSCFKAVGSTPAWQLLDAAGLRGAHIGDVRISQKHANFLESGPSPRFDDAVALVRRAQATVPHGLTVEMRFVDADGSMVF